jgi:phosphatidylserine/phosphatidylglycerophosphate/cardiolipin synthase-like enzyme
MGWLNSSVWWTRAALRLALFGFVGSSVSGCGGAPVAPNGLPVPPRAAALTLVESWPAETPLDHPDIPDASQVWLDMIGAATTSMDFAFFYGVDQPGSALSEVVAAVARKAAAGVRVRFVFDKKFYSKNKEIPDYLKTLPGVEVRIWDGDAHMGGVLHAKYFIIDAADPARAQAYFGSQNFDWRSLEHIYELGVWLREPLCVQALADTFSLDWALAGADAAAISQLNGQRSYPFPVSIDYAGQPARVSIALSPKAWITDPLSWDLPPLLDAIASARVRVRVQLLSYHTESYDKSRFDDLDLALRAAASRGVQVELMVADWSKKPSAIKPLQDLQRLDNLTVKLVTIPPWSGGFIPFARVIHAKFMTVDGRSSWIGTSNWSGDYFLKSRNVGVTVEGAPFASDLDRVFDSLWHSPFAEVVDPDGAYEEPAYKDPPVSP